MFMLEDARRRLEIITGEYDDMLQALIDSIRAAADDFMGVRYSKTPTAHEELHDGG